MPSLAGPPLRQLSPDDTGVGFLGVADLAGFVDHAFRDPDAFKVRIWNLDLAIASVARNLAPRLRRIILVRDTTVGRCLCADRCRTGLGLLSAAVRPHGYSVYDGLLGSSAGLT